MAAYKRQRLTKFEIPAILSARAKQLANGAKSKLEKKPNESPLELAKRELLKKVIPLKITRVFPSGKKQEIRLPKAEIVEY